MTAEQISKLGTAYKHAKAVLDQIQDSGQIHTIFELSAAVGALESLCLKAQGAAVILTDTDRAQFVAAARNGKAMV